MKLFTSLKYLAGLVAAIVAWFGLAGQARAVFTLSGTAAELVARGINADFETPAKRAATARPPAPTISAPAGRSILSAAFRIITACRIRPTAFTERLRCRRLSSSFRLVFSI